MATQADTSTANDAQGPGDADSDAGDDPSEESNILESGARRRGMAEVFLETTFTEAPRRARGLQMSAKVKDDQGMLKELQMQPEEEVCWTRNMKTLGLTAALFATITVLQSFGAVAAKSTALLLDCISMGVDAGTYVGNMFVEWRRNTRCHGPLELIVAAISLVLLIYFTADELDDVVRTLRALARNGRISEGKKEVNGYIILGFALGGVVFDLVSLNSFRKNHRKTKSGKQMNMWTALLHVGADLLRSCTTLVLSLLILFAGTDGTATDAWASLFVGATILVGAAVGVLGWFRKFVKYTLAEYRRDYGAEAESTAGGRSTPVGEGSKV